MNIAIILCMAFTMDLHCLSGNTLAYKPPAQNSVIILGGGGVGGRRYHSDNTIPYEKKFTQILERICIALAATALLTNPMLCLCLCYVNAPIKPCIFLVAFEAKATHPREAQMLGFTSANHAFPRARKVARILGVEAF